MEPVRTDLRGKKVILLNGAHAQNEDRGQLDIEELDKLLDAARRNPDAVAFGYMSGIWVAAA